LWSAGDAWLKPLATAGIIAVLGASTLSILAGNVAAGLALVLVFFRFRVRGGDEPLAPASVAWRQGIRSEFIRFAVPLIPLAILAWLTSLADRYVIAGIGGMEAAGLYAAAYGLASQPFISLGTLVNTALRPVFFGAVARDDRSKERRTFALWIAAVAGGSAIGVVLVILLREPLVRLVLGPRFWGAASLLPWIAGAYAMQAVQQVFEARLYAQRRTKRVTLLQVVSSTLAVLLYLALIPGMGAKGAAVGIFCALAASCVVSIVIASGSAPLLPPEFEPRRTIGEAE